VEEDPEEVLGDDPDEDEPWDVADANFSRPPVIVTPVYEAVIGERMVLVAVDVEKPSVETMMVTSQEAETDGSILQS